MDSYGTLETYEKLLKELDRDPQSKKVYYDIQLKLVDVILRSSSFRGMKVNQAKANEYYKMYKEKVDELECRAQALVGWPINVGSNDQTWAQLFGVERIQDKAFPPKKGEKNEN